MTFHVKYEYMLTLCARYMQRLVEMRVGVRVVLALFQVACALCGILGFLGALQALPAVAVMTSAIIKCAGTLLEFSIMVVVILPLASLILYNANIADERLTLPPHLATYMIISTFSGVT